jgi:biopolymer transport protein ExbB/TolQ
VAIGMSGSGMLEKVAGPVSEALIMTGIGLAVALPAVMGYSWLTSSNRVLTATLDAGTRRQVGQRAARRSKPLTRETSSCTETSL